MAPDAHATLAALYPRTGQGAYSGRHRRRAPASQTLVTVLGQKPIAGAVSRSVSSPLIPPALYRRRAAGRQGAGCAI